jgi:processing peptidase subunit alpha
MAMLRRSLSVSAGARGLGAARRSIWGMSAQPAAGDSLELPMDITCPAPLFDGATATEVTTLDNGLKVASSDLPSPATTLGIYVESGSRFDEVSGTAHLMQHMAFKSSNSMSALKMVTVCENVGATVSALSSRENTVYQIDTLKSSVPELVGLLAETTLAPKFLSWEVEEAHGTVKAELEDLKLNHQALLQEMAHAAAYGRGSPLGMPAMCPPGNLSAISPAVLQKFAADNMAPNRMVLAAAGYDHQELVALAQATFGKASGGAPPHAAASPYTGGEVRETADEPISHFALSFEGVGWKDSALVPLCVLNTLMGGGASFSAGGPGKGMYTRLYQNILNRYGFAQSASVFNAFYNDTGLFGVYGAAPAENMGQLVAALCEEMSKMAGAISDQELSRAKNQLKSSLLMNLESRPILFEDIGRQVLTYGARTPASELVQQIESVTAADLNKVATKLLKSEPSIIVYGDTTCVPRYDVIARQFK